MGKRRLWIALGLLVMMFALWGGRRWFAGDGERADGLVTSTKSGVADPVLTALRARRAKHGVVQGAIYARGWARFLAKSSMTPVAVWLARGCVPRPARPVYVTVIVVNRFVCVAGLTVAIASRSCGVHATA